MHRIDFDRIPKPVYDDLVNVFGIEEAHKIIHNYDYNMYAIAKKRGNETFIRFLRIRELYKWLKLLLKRINLSIKQVARCVRHRKIIYYSLLIISIISTILFILRLV